ncbi:MAG: alpha-1,4-glucan--maltose-1-phosphate maltosyltransferase [Chthoniobacteraceae bacterium]
MHPHPPTVVIENVTPLIEGGRYPVKRAVGEDLTIEADVFKDGHDVVVALLKWRVVGTAKWHETPMTCVEAWNKDHWRGTCSFFEMGAHEITIEAWGDTFRSWQHEFSTKFKANEPNLASETLEGAQFIEQAALRAVAAGQQHDAGRLREIAAEIRAGAPEQVDNLAHEHELEALMTSYADRSEATEFTLNAAELIGTVDDLLPPKPAPKKAKSRGKKKVAIEESVDPPITDHRSPVTPDYPRVWVDRERALIGAWYEFFPRSAEGRGDKGSTFRDCLARVDDAKAMGFDVIYFPPIHPVGVTARKGRNNSVTCEPGEPGVPYAIGNRHQKCPNGGGHKDVAPELGTLEDFDWLVGEIHARGMEVALDFALNCSPDHPYVAAHPEWFYQRPDGTIKYAENPPKKYQDVYPLNYHNPSWPVLWDELTSVIEFWCEHGVRIFRVDNPHTKPVAFWEYMIGRVQRRWPDAIFLSEAFTKSKMMRVLARAGFTQSYTYFTWRNTKDGLTGYFTELTGEVADVMRPNLFANTPDILPSYLQFGGRPAFAVRAVLAATLAPTYGIYSGFELCENAGLWRADFDAARDVRHFLNLCDFDYKQLAKEEYWESEKYQWKQRDWNSPGNIKPLVTRLNAIRRENRALQQLRNLRFVPCDNDLVLAYAKQTVARDNCLLIIVNLDPFHAQDAYVTVPLEDFGLSEQEVYQVHDLLTGERFHWKGRSNFVRLNPAERPGHVFRVRRKLGSERDFDYFQ